MAVPDTGRHVHVEHGMGTVFSFDVRTPDDPSDAVAEAVAWLHRVDRVFSTYRADSDISRLARRELRLDDADPDVASVLALCADVRVVTDGWFDPLVAGRIDPTGLVKGWAVERASAILTSHGHARHAVNGGGDVQVTGGTGADHPWRVAVADPADTARHLAVVQLTDGAVATSGTTERGRHILDPHTGRPTTSTLCSATVIGPSLTYADCYATACFAMGGPAALAWIDDVDGYELLLVEDTGTVRTSRGAAALLG